MRRIRRLKFALAAAALVTATPALASDFSGIYYAFLIAGAIVAGIIAVVVFTLRKFATSTGPVFDIVCAVVLGVGFAPAGFVHEYGETYFTLLPAWLWILLAAQEVAGATSFLGPIISIIVVSLAFFWWFRHRRLQRVDREAE